MSLLRLHGWAWANETLSTLISLEVQFVSNDGILKAIAIIHSPICDL